MFDTVTVIGAGGRAGSAISARLRERGIELRDEGGELVLLCVPDTAIADVAASIDPGPWVGARERDDAARRARSARAPLQRPSAPDARQEPRPGAARRRVRRRDGGDRRRARACDVAGDDAGPGAVPPGGRRANALPRRRRHRLQLPRDPVPDGRGALRGRRRTAKGARSAHAAHDRERLRAHRPDRAR